MAQMLLLFGLLALADGQLVYPDQYERMTVDPNRSLALGLLTPALKTANNSQPVQIYNQSNQASVPQFGVPRPNPGTAQIYPTTQLPSYTYPSVSPLANSTTIPLLENWSDHVSRINIVIHACATIK